MFCSSAAATRCEARPHTISCRAHTPCPVGAAAAATWPQPSRFQVAAAAGRRTGRWGDGSCPAGVSAAAWQITPRPAARPFQCLQLLPCAGNYVEASCHAAPDTPAGQTPAAFCRGKTRHAPLRGKNKPYTKRYTTKGPRNRLTKVHNASRCPANAQGKAAQQHLPISWLAP